MTEELLMPFFTDDPEFVYGFEAGQLWEKLKNGESVQGLYHKANREHVEMICLHYERYYEIATVDETWIELITLI